MSPTNGSGNGYFDPGFGPELPDPGLEASEGPDIEAGHMQITVWSEYATDQSNPQRWRYVFVYHIRIENIGEEPAQLFWRHWRIHDPVAGEHEVQGEGVVGETPWLGPGDIHEYNSFCVLHGPMGHMEGFYHFRREDGSVFRAPIPRFFLQAPPGTGSYLA
jgi:ApaG protein